MALIWVPCSKSSMRVFALSGSGQNQQSYLDLLRREVMEVRVINRVSQLLAAGSCCGCVAVAGITSFMQSFAAGVWTVIL